MSYRMDREMARSVRLAFAPIMGILLGILVVKLLVRSDPYGAFGNFSFTRGIFVIVSEAVMGFGIAISGLRMPWPMHGALLGLTFSLPMSIWIARVYSMSEARYNVRLFFLLIVLNVLFGLLIELVLSGILGARGQFASGQPVTASEAKAEQKPLTT